MDIDTVTERLQGRYTSFGNLHDVVAPMKALNKLKVSTNCRKIGNWHDSGAPKGVLYKFQKPERSIGEPTSVYKLISRLDLSQCQHVLFKLECASIWGAL